MFRRQLLAAMVIGLLCLSTASARAANHVTVESRTIGANATACPVHIRIDNDVTLMAVVVPLVIREVTPGAFITDIRLHWDDRLVLGGPMNELRVTNIYAEQDGACAPVGFKTISSQDTYTHPVLSSPEGVLFAGVAFSPTTVLQPGTDATGSMVMDLSTTGTTGTFEIDTICIDPQNNLSFGPYPTGLIFVPGFTKGTITIAPNSPPIVQCANVVVGAQAGCVVDASVDAGSFDPDGDATSIWQDPPGPYPLGQTIVTMYVQDAKCALDSCEAIVTVEDVTPPSIVCPHDTVVVVQAGDGGAYVDFGVTATDECSGATIQSNPASGSFFSLGLTTVTSVATDGAGNWSQCQFRVAVLADNNYCNDQGEDMNCDGLIDATDMNHIIDVIFFNAPVHGPCCYPNAIPE